MKKVICHSCEKETDLSNARLHNKGAYYCRSCIQKVIFLSKILDSIRCSVDIMNETMGELFND